MSAAILTCNAGSSNTKLALFDADTLERTAQHTTHSAQETLEWVGANTNARILSIGHRVVHGGREMIAPMRVNEAVLAKLHSYTPLAPLHQPAALQLIAQLQERYPEVAQIACFDTAFHATTPEIERRLPLPHWYHRQGIQRYGFHGLSYQYIASVLPRQAGARSYGRVVVAHLGNGSSACAMRHLKSVATTMGFSTLDGLMMGTRSGAIDPGVMLYLLKDLEMHVPEVDRLLYLESGLQGVSGISADMRHLLASESVAAKEAIALYCYNAAKQIAGLLPTIGGMDMLVFTGGIGENAAPVREHITQLLRWLGDFPVYVIPTDEESVIAHACYAIESRTSSFPNSDEAVWQT